MTACLACPPEDFVLPVELEATAPPAVRDGVRLLVTEGRATRHAAFVDVANALVPGDLLVVNDSATMPAAVPARSLHGHDLRLHFSTPLPGLDGPYGQGHAWIVEPRGHEACEGDVLTLAGGARATLLRRHRGLRLWVARLDGIGSTSNGDALGAVPVLDYLQRHGGPVRYPYLHGEWPMSAWQTIFARRPGSAEMPSAARPFTPRVLRSLQRRGVDIATLTLHTGVASLERTEAPYAEWYDVPARTMRRIEQTRGRVIAVGTTVVRALESTAQGLRGWTERVITPGQRLAHVDGLITGLHEPRATHLQMLRALCDDDTLRAAYQAALDARYRWHEFGDLHLILP